MSNGRIGPMASPGGESHTQRLLALWCMKHFQYKVTYDGYGKEHDEWLFRDDMLEDLGAESLEDYEKEFYGKHPTAKRHTDEIKVRTKGKRSVRRK